jgi:hypothetical protein
MFNFTMLLLEWRSISTLVRQSKSIVFVFIFNGLNLSLFVFIVNVKI